MAALYADENFPLPVVEELRRLGHDVLTAFEDGRANQRVADDAVLRRATQLGRAVLTTNRRHFVKLHLESGEHHGIIACTFDPDFAGQAKRIHEDMQSRPYLDGQLIRINRPGASV